MLRANIALATLLCLLPPPPIVLNAQISATSTEQKSEKEWKVGDEHGANTNIEFDTNEGTRMSVDVNPDGKEIVFDLLGDIYTIPITGGEAKLLSGGTVWEMQPRFSPTGQEIAFISDRSGADNIWLMNSDGTNQHQLTKETFRLLSTPEWTADGNWIMVRKNFTSTRALGAGEIWLYHTRGGKGMPLIPHTGDTSCK